MIRVFAHLPQLYLKPGELHVTGDPTLVTTVLGSCVSLTFFARSRGISGICHAMLPETTPGDWESAFRFVDASVVHLIERFDRLGIPRRQIEVKLFGGADVLAMPGRRPEAQTVGRKNIAAAKMAIVRERLVLQAADVGGTTGRKLFFVTHTGEVLLKKLEKGGIT